MTRLTLAVALSGALCGLILGPVLAQNAVLAAAMPTKLKPKTPESASTVTVVVTNSRKADLVQLQATESGLVGWKKVLGALKSGNHAPVQVPHPFNCRIDLHFIWGIGEPWDQPSTWAFVLAAGRSFFLWSSAPRKRLITPNRPWYNMIK